MLPSKVMADLANKRCPRCGKRPIDRRLVQCPDCHVPFEYDQEASSHLTQAQLTAALRQMSGSWKIQVVLLLLAAGFVWGIIQITQLRNDLHDVARQNTNDLAVAHEQILKQISTQISNQVAAEFRDPAIHARIEQIASEKAGDAITNTVWASMTAFRESLNQANAQLAKATNDIAVLSNDVKVAQQKMTQINTVVSDQPPLLHLADQTVTRDGTNYVLTLFFKGTLNKAVGPVDLIAGTYRQTAKIVSFNVKNAEQVQPIVLNESGDAARLKFTFSRTDTPLILEIELTAATIVKLVGDQLEEELTLPVAIDKMQIPVTAR